MRKLAWVLVLAVVMVPSLFACGGAGTEALRRGAERRAGVRARLEQARRSILLEALFREVAENARVQSYEVLRRYYEENKANLETGERIRVRHILFKEEGKAEEAARRARKGEPFDQLMREAGVAGGSSAGGLRSPFERS